MTKRAYETNRKNQLLAVIFISALVVFHAVNNYNVLAMSSMQMGYDEVNYFSAACSLLAAFHGIFSDGRLLAGGMKLVALCQQCDLGAPRSNIFFFPAFIFLAMGRTATWAVISNAIYLGILLSATYGLGKRLYGFKSGVLATFIVAFLPGVYAMSRVYMRDLALAAFVTLALYCLVELCLTGGKKTWRLYCLTAFSFAVGIAIKETFAVYIAFPIMFLFTYRDFREKSSLIRFAIILLPVLLMVLIWFFRADWPIYVGAWRYKATLLVSRDACFYLRHLYSVQLLPVFFWLLAVAVAYRLIQKDAFSFFLIIVPIAFFSFVSPNKVSRFLLPIFGFIAIALARFVCDFSKKRDFLAYALIVLALLQYYIMTYRLGVPLSFCHPAFNRQEDGLCSITTEVTYKDAAQSVFNLIAAASRPCADQAPRRVLVLESEGLYTDLMELAAATPTSYVLSRWEDDDYYALRKMKQVSEIKNAHYLVCQKNPRLEFENASAYYRDFLSHRDRLAWLGAVTARARGTQAAVQFDVYRYKG